MMSLATKTKPFCVNLCQKIEEKIKITYRFFIRVVYLMILIMTGAKSVKVFVNSVSNESI